MRARNAARPSSSRAKRSCPLMRTPPPVGVSRPASKPRRVDLPEPDTPTIATASPALIAKLMSLSMVNPVPPLGTVLPSVSTRMIVSWDLSDMSLLARILTVVVLAAAPGVGAAASAAPSGTILVFGDSLSASYGLPQAHGWPRLLEKRLRDEGFAHRVANASLSGETTAGGAARIEGALKTHRPDIVVIELG